MRFDLETHELRTDDGRLLKQLYCPLDKAWSTMMPIRGDERRRLCQSCRKEVVSLEGMTDDQVRSLIDREPDACVMVPLGAANITIEGKAHSPHDVTPRPCPLRVIETARGLDEIRSLTTPTLRPLVVPVPLKQGMHFAAWQNPETGEVVISEDPRYSTVPQCPSNEHRSWNMVLAWQRYSQGHPQGDDGVPIAAYMIPSDLRPGELVFVSDIIEQLPSLIHMSLGSVISRRSAPAVWTGECFRFRVPLPSTVIG